MNEDFKKLIKKWVKLEQEIKILEYRLAKLNEKKEIINPLLEKYLKDNNNLKINKKNKLKYKEKDYYNNIDKIYLTKTLNEIIDDKDKVDKIIDYVYRNRDIITIKYLFIK